MARKKGNAHKQSPQESIPSSKKKKKICNNFEQARNSLENWEFHFNLGHIEQIKTTLKTKDIDEVPLIIGAVILNEKEILQSLLKHGYNINEADKNNLTPLMWAIKLKHIDMVNILMENNADPKLKPENRDEIIFTAISLTLWDEETFLLLFDRLKSAGLADVNALSRSGFSLLHLAVRREWKTLVDVLIFNDANVNIATANGITPLMQACYRNDLDIVIRLLEKGAAVKRRNSDGFTALCYAYSSAITKDLQPPFFVIERLHSELVKAKVDLEKYLKERLKMIGVPNKCRTTDQPCPELVLQHVFTFILRNLSNSFEMLTVDLSCGKILKEALEKFVSDKENLKLPLTILNLIFNHAPFDQDVHSSLLEEFIKSGCFDMCIKIMRGFENDPVILQLAMTPIIIFTVGYSVAQEWYDIIKDEVASFLPKYEDVYDLIEATPDQIKFIQECLQYFKANICKLPINPFFDNENCPLLDQIELKTSTKKNKRRTNKALKANISKIKSAELMKRFNLNKTVDVLSKPTEEKKEDIEINEETEVKNYEEVNLTVDTLELPILPSEEIENKEEVILDMEEEVKIEPEVDEEIQIETEDKTEIIITETKIETNPPKEIETIPEPEPEKINELKISTSVTNLKKEIVPKDPDDWKTILRNLPFSNSKMIRQVPGIRLNNSLEWKWSNVDVKAIIKYLEHLLRVIQNRYEYIWQHDKPLSEELLFGYAIPSLEIDELDLQSVEKTQLTILQQKFKCLTNNVKDYFDMEPKTCINILRELEKFLLRHSIRGQTIMNAMTAKEIITLNVSMPIELEQELATYMENVLEGNREEAHNIKISFKEHVSIQKH